MGVGKSIEGRLEGLVEGFFTRVFRSGLQPVEVGRRIIREMGDGKTVSVNRVYAPNEFRVSMSAEDHERFAQMEAGLQKEFSELVIDAAKENRWNLMGLPEISFVVEESYGKGQFAVEASFAADERPQVSTHEPDPAAPSQTGAISLDTAHRLGISKKEHPTLLVLDGDGKPSEKISLTRSPVSVGRMSSNDVVLADSNVSRRHAELRQESDGWVVEDQGSTNGTLVNGRPVSRHRLTDGDRMRFGTSELTFKAGG